MLGAGATHAPFLPGPAYSRLRSLGKLSSRPSPVWRQGWSQEPHLHKQQEGLSAHLGQLPETENPRLLERAHQAAGKPQGPTPPNFPGLWPWSARQAAPSPSQALKPEWAAPGPPCPSSASPPAPVEDCQGWTWGPPWAGAGHSLLGGGERITYKQREAAVPTTGPLCPRLLESTGRSCCLSPRARPSEVPTAPQVSALPLHSLPCLSPRSWPWAGPPGRPRGSGQRWPSLAFTTVVTQPPRKKESPQPAPQSSPSLLSATDADGVYLRGDASPRPGVNLLARSFLPG